MELEDAVTVSLCVYVVRNICILPSPVSLVLSGPVEVYKLPVSKAFKVIDRLDGSLSHVFSHCLP